MRQVSSKFRVPSSRFKVQGSRFQVQSPSKLKVVCSKVSDQGPVPACPACPEPVEGSLPKDKVQSYSRMEARYIKKIGVSI